MLLTVLCYQRHSPHNDAARLLWSQIARHALHLQRYEDAYLALISQPDAERRIDGLRHFITVVCENDEAQLLSSLPFAGLQGELESTLAFKARNVLVTVDLRPNYYKILYAHHVRRSDYRNGMFRLRRGAMWTLVSDSQ